MKNNKIFKKIVASTLAIIFATSFLFTGCKSSSPMDNDKDNKKEKVIDKKEQSEEQAKFDEYMNELFIDEMSLNSVSTHFSLENPEAYGISFEEASWGEPYTFDSIEEDFEEQKEILDNLNEFDSSLLTEEQQITYDTLYMYLENSYASKDYYLFEEIFSPLNGLQAEIPIIFSEYDFFDEDDIDDYLTLLETVDDYINSMLEYEALRAKEGYFLTEDSADSVIHQCKDFLAPEENCLVSIFSDKLDDFGIADDQKAAYMDRLNQAIKNDLIPAYENIIRTLEALKGSRTTESGLAGFDGGSEYYELLVRSYTGSAKSVDEIIEMVEENLADDLSLVYTIMTLNSDIFEEYEAFEYPDLDTVTSIEMQIECAKDYFPETDHIPYEVKNVPKSLESSMSPAFYLVPPVDNKDKNMIYINNYEEYASMNLFTTLAHEGVPGHMYQCYYFASTNPDPMRCVLNFGGYNEGWATYVEQYAYKFAGMNDSLASFSTANDRFNFALYCRIDLGLHYEGWSYEDAADFLELYGVADEELIKEVYDTLIDDPGVYLQYYIGCLEIEELREKAENKIESFDEIEFHRFILDIGPTFYDVIDDRLDVWIKEENSMVASK